ncbi:O-antigen ligase family protein [Microbacterium sp.]|uniref:O-antigen ligase family protein n=1 Tax=Microbacterium sp. TaxID=51671 RepID=UPI0028123E9C|nr:O-antigen ligase family protein [Microbacterium sp.]
MNTGPSRTSVWAREGTTHRPAGRTAERRTRQLSFLIAAALAYTSMPAMVSLVQNGRQYDLANSTSSVVLTAFAEGMRTPLAVVLIGVCIVIVLQNAAQSAHQRAGRLLLVIGALAAMVIMDVLISGSFNDAALLLILIAITVWTMGLASPDLRILGVVAGIVSVGSLVLALFWPAAWQQNDEKGFLGEDVLAGAFSQMNVLGIALAVLLPFALLLRTRTMRWTVMVASVLTLFLAASRTSLIAAGISVLVMLVLRVQKQAVARTATIWMAAGAVIVMVILLPLITDDRGAFTSRGAIWINTRGFAAESWATGHGLETFRFGGPLYQVTHMPAAHAHNLFLHYVAMMGLLGLVTLVVLVLPAVRAAANASSTRIAFAGSVTAMLGLGIAEVPLRVETFDGPAWATWLVWFCLLFVALDDRGVHADAWSARSQSSQRAGKDVGD